MSRQGIPAVSVAIVVDHQIRFQRGYGMADLENFVPAKAATVYRIASVSKPITAVAAMQLAEKGKLDLDAPIQKYVPSFPTKNFPVTTRQLLAHLSGIRHYKPGEGERTNRYESLTDALSIFKDDPLEGEPGTRFTYSTFGYTLLGAVIEGASGMAFMDYLREYIFKPAGMQHTQADDIYAIIPNRAKGYTPRVYARFDGNVRNAALMDSSYKLPGGGLVSTAEDMARFAIAVQNGGLIKRETFEQMSISQKTRDGRETGYSYGWYIDRREGREPDGSIWHGGVQSGFTADLWMLPKRRFALVILTNLEGGGRLGLGTLGNQIADIVLQ
jgi:CubicO group peptidase (beta-lactamase class C family)